MTNITDNVTFKYEEPPEKVALDPHGLSDMASRISCDLMTYNVTSTVMFSEAENCEFTPINAEVQGVFTMV